MTSPETIRAVEALLMMPFILMGLSHILRPQLWIGLFTDLARQGDADVVWRTFAFELWPAVLIVTFHQDWSWPGVLLTLYGHVLLVKIAVSLLVLSFGQRSLDHANFGEGGGMRFSGVVLLGLGVLCIGQTLH